MPTPRHLQAEALLVSPVSLDFTYSPPHTFCLTNVCIDDRRNEVYKKTSPKAQHKQTNKKQSMGTN